MDYKYNIGNTVSLFNTETGSKELHVVLDRCRNILGNFYMIQGVWYSEFALELNERTMANE